MGPTRGHAKALAMSRSTITAAAKIVRTTANPQRAEPAVARDVSDPDKLVRIVNRIRDDVRLLGTSTAPDSIDFEDLPAGASGVKITLPHRMGCRVRWYVIDWTATSPGVGAIPTLTKHSTSDANTLVLVSYVAGTVSIRVEAAR